MKKTITLGLSLLVSALLCISSFSITALAGTLSGHLDSIDSTQIIGWAWNSSDTNETVTVELQIYPSGSETQIRTATITADSYREDLHDSIGDGYHGFSYSIDWSEFKGNSFQVKAYAISGEEKLPLIGSMEYTKPAKAATAETVEITQTAKASKKSAPVKNDPAAFGPGVAKDTAAVAATTAGTAQSGEKGTSLGIFTTTGYCCCSKCSGGHNLTYSGTVPKAEHTISTDINLLPLGSNVMINGIIYTVEDIGSSVNGKKIDIFYSTHDAAWAHGMQQEEVFSVQ